MCYYKNIFGAPGTGIHSYRILNIAIFDVLFTIIGAFLIYKFLVYLHTNYINYFFFKKGT